MCKAFLDRPRLVEKAAGFCGLDVLTDALALVGQHGVYCRSTRQPQFPSMDVRIVMEQIESSKGLIIEAMEYLKKRSYE